MRFHGLQSVILGVAWPVALYVGSVVSRLATNAAFILGLVVWITLLVSSARGGALRLPLVGSFCARLAAAKKAEVTDTETTDVP